MSSSETEMEVSEILGERKSKKGLEYLVRWKGFGATEDSWEPMKNLVNAISAVTEFRSVQVTQTKKGRKASPSRGRSRSRSRSRSPSRSRSKKSASKSPSRGKKKASSTTRTRSSSRSRNEVVKVTSSESKGVKERKVEMVKSSPGRIEKTETITQSYKSPSSQTHTISNVTRTTEVRTTTDRPPFLRRLKFADPLKSIKQRCGGLMRTDYPAIVVFATIAIVTLSFLIQDKVKL